MWIANDQIKDGSPTVEDSCRATSEWIKDDLEVRRKVSFTFCNEAKVRQSRHYKKMQKNSIIQNCRWMYTVVRSLENCLQRYKAILSFQWPKSLFHISVKKQKKCLENLTMLPLVFNVCLFIYLPTYFFFFHCNSTQTVPGSLHYLTLLGNKVWVGGMRPLSKFSARTVWKGSSLRNKGIAAGGCCYWEAEEVSGLNWKGKVIYFCLFSFFTFLCVKRVQIKDPLFEPWKRHGSARTNPVGRRHSPLIKPPSWHPF